MRHSPGLRPASNDSRIRGARGGNHQNLLSEDSDKSFLNEETEGNGRTAWNMYATTIRSQDNIMEGENGIIEQIIKGMIDGVTTVDANNDKENDQTRTMNCHAEPTLSHGMVGMALEVAATPASAVAGTNCGEEDAQQPVDGRELETRVSITGYLASMIRYRKILFGLHYFMYPPLLLQVPRNGNIILL